VTGCMVHVGQTHFELRDVTVDEALKMLRQGAWMRWPDGKAVRSSAVTAITPVDFEARSWQEGVTP
jgi:hypothetical protein